MSANNFGDSMEWGRGRSSGSRKGKRAGNSSSDKPRQPQRGLGVAQLEKIRIQSEMAESLHHPLGQPPPIHGTGTLNLMGAYGGRGDIRYGEFQSTPTIRSPPNYHGAIHGAAHYSAYPSSDATLPLFEPEESICLKRHHDLNQSAESSTSMNSDDPQDVDLELKL